ncbi:MAG TPA: hypothetical protein EYM38_00550 [Dehalococcoidia bacterium]|nr:hypothetical protein [Dehalococcoidia bacterium]
MNERLIGWKLDITTASGRRSQIELVYEILALCGKESPRRTRIMYQVRLSYAQL